MGLVSADTEPNRSSSSSRVSAIRASGTGSPWLNRSGSSTSKRRYGLLILRRSFDEKRDTLKGKKSQCLFRDKHLARGPTGERETAREEPEGAAFGFQIGETDDNHDLILARTKRAKQRECRSSGTLCL